MMFSVPFCVGMLYKGDHGPCRVVARVHNNKSVQLPCGFHYHHLGSMTMNTTEFTQPYVHVHVDPDCLRLMYMYM